MNDGNINHFDEPKTQEDFESSITRMVERQKALAGDTILFYTAPTLKRADFAGRAIVLEYALAPWMSNLSGKLHGGITATLFDNSFGLLARSLSGKMASVTTGLQVNFLRPVDVERPLYVETRADSMGASLACFYSRAWQEPDGERPCATATGTFFMRA